MDSKESIENIPFSHIETVVNWYESKIRNNCEYCIHNHNSIVYYNYCGVCSSNFEITDIFSIFLKGGIHD